MPGYMSVSSCVSPATAAIRFCPPRADRQTRGRIADALLHEFEVAVDMAGLAFGSGAEQHRDVVLAFDVGLVREVQVAAIGLRFARERVAQALLGFRSFQSHDDLLVKQAAQWASAQHCDGLPSPLRVARGHGLLLDCRLKWGGSSAGRASRSQCEGREFDPPPLHHLDSSKVGGLQRGVDSPMGESRIGGQSRLAFNCFLSSTVPVKKIQ